MRILQARFVGLATMLVVALFLGVSPGIAQKAGGGTTAPAPRVRERYSNSDAHPSSAHGA